MQKLEKIFDEKSAFLARKLVQMLFERAKPVTVLSLFESVDDLAGKMMLEQEYNAAFPTKPLLCSSVLRTLIGKGYVIHTTHPWLGEDAELQLSDEGKTFFEENYGAKSG